jgi:hypothetical protein
MSEQIAEQWDALRPDVMPEAMTGHADLAGTAAAQHRPLGLGPDLDRPHTQHSTTHTNN